MGNGTALLLTLLSAAVFLYALFFVVRAGVEQGIRRALPSSALRPDNGPVADGRTRPSQS